MKVLTMHNLSAKSSARRFPACVSAQLFIKISLRLLLPVFADAQQKNKQLDSLRMAFGNAANDNHRFETF